MVDDRMAEDYNDALKQRKKEGMVFSHCLSSECSF